MFNVSICCVPRTALITASSLFPLDIGKLPVCQLTHDIVDRQKEFLEFLCDLICRTYTKKNEKKWKVKGDGSDFYIALPLESSILIY